MFDLINLRLFFNLLSRLTRATKHIIKIFIALLLSIGVALGTSAIAWLLDPAVKKIFIEQDKSMMVLIPIAIVIAFSVKGLSLYFARTILIRLSNEITSWK